MTHVLALLGHIRHTTISYELSERLGRETDLDVTVVSYEDRSIDDIDVPIDTEAVRIEPLGARSRFDRKAIRRLRALLTSGEFDLLHTHHNFVGALGRALAPGEIAIVDTEHADHQLHYSAPQNAVNATTLWRADRVVANSQATLDSFYPHERLLVPERKRRVIYNGIDLEKIDALRSGANPWESDHPRIVTVGRMIPAKNQRLLVAAFEAVQRVIPDAELVIVGDGPEREALEDAITTRELSENVRLTGTVPRDTVYRILDASDVFALSSRSEGFCVALVEAMACETAPLVSDIPVLHEVAGDTACFAEPDSPREFADWMYRLLNDHSLGERYAKRASERARTTFPLDRTVEEYGDLYGELLS